MLARTKWDMKTKMQTINSEFGGESRSIVMQN